jgi:outer membrane protein OmpA-like peptidoglycan-associated protein
MLATLARIPIMNFPEVSGGSRTMGILARALAACALVFALGATAGAAQDAAGASDHPLVGRYEGSVITFYETKAYAELALPNKAVERGQGKDAGAWQAALSGELTSIRYEGPGNRSALEILRNHEAALMAKGFDILFSCASAKACAPGGSASDFWNVARGGIGMPTNWNTSVYLLARKDNGDGVYTVGMLGVETKPHGDKPLTPHFAVTIVKAQPMEGDKIKLVEASEMEQALARDGRIAIYGIYFDFDKADIKAESQPQIAELGALLKDNPKLEVLIVGHTDGKGAFDYNLSLSQRRAQSVADVLVAGHGVDRARLTPAGAGMVAPVATNRTEDGRARNRRVEIVERITDG